MLKQTEITELINDFKNFFSNYLLFKIFENDIIILNFFGIVIVFVNNLIFCCFQIPEYCRVIDESDVQEHAFELIFAFDEVVALGYRESVNLAQIRTFTEMDSHEEKVFNAVRKVHIFIICFSCIVFKG